jgi:DNA mismatch repair protein MutS
MVPGAAPALSRDPGQLPLFGDQQPDPMVEELKSLNVNTLTPLEALNRLADFQRRAGQRLNQAQLHADEH